MIDIDIFKYFTVGYRQYIAYIKDLKNITIDITKAKAVYIQFGIGLILSMRSIII